MNRICPIAILGTMVLAGAGCGVITGSGSGSASASASVSVKSGHFFGHDLRREQSVVYVLDLSGSMSGSSGSIAENAATGAAGTVAGGMVGGFAGRGAGNAVEDRIKRLRKKIEKVKLHLIASLGGLPQSTQFNVVMFSDGVQKLAPTMLQAGGATKLAVSAFVDRLEEGGSTNMYRAVEEALYTGASHVIVLTDGLPTSSTPDAILDLVARYNTDGQVRVSTVGVGGDQAREFLDLLARENGGQFTRYN